MNLLRGDRSLFVLEGRYSKDLLKESVDFEAIDSAVGITIESGEDGEGLEVWVTREALSLSLDLDLLFGNSLEKVFELKLCFNSNH
jgi:hypothetical protein